jgi:Ion channel
VTPPGRAAGGWRGRLEAPDRYGLVLLLILATLVVIGLAGDTAAGAVPALLLLARTLLFTLHTARAPPRVQRRARLLVGGAVGLALLALASGRPTLAAGVATAVVGLLVLATPPAIAWRLLQHPVIDAATVLGAACVYLLLGLFFASVFALTAVVGGPFFVTVAAPGAVDYLYFSYVTLTTVGYGDLTARGDAGRMLAVCEALLGQLYLVTVLALLVGHVGRPRPRRAGPEGPEPENAP